jgi:hypothetical protein
MAIILAAQPVILSGCPPQRGREIEWHQTGDADKTVSLSCSMPVTAHWIPPQQSFSLAAIVKHGMIHFTQEIIK